MFRHTHSKGCQLGSPHFSTTPNLSSALARIRIIKYRLTRLGGCVFCIYGCLRANLRGTNATKATRF